MALSDEGSGRRMAVTDAVRVGERGADDCVDGRGADDGDRMGDPGAEGQGGPVRGRAVDSAACFGPQSGAGEGGVSSRASDAAIFGGGGVMDCPGRI